MDYATPISFWIEEEDTKVRRANNTRGAALTPARFCERVTNNPFSLKQAIFSTAFFDISFDDNGADNPIPRYVSATSYIAITIPLIMVIATPWWMWCFHTIIRRRLSTDNLVTSARLSSNIPLGKVMR